MLVFALLVILIFNFAIELQPNLRSTITPGVLWVTFAFAGTLGLNRSMAVEKDRGCLDGLLLVAGGSIGDLFWKNHQQSRFHADCRGDRFAGV